MAPQGESLATGRYHRRIRIDLAGGCVVTLDGRRLAPTELGSRRGRLLLELLAAARGRALSCDEIVEVLWPTGPPGRPEAAVATLVSRLRSVLGAEAVLGARGSYRQGMAPQVQVDLDEAATFVSEAEHRLPAEPAARPPPRTGALRLLARPAWRTGATTAGHSRPATSRRSWCDGPGRWRPEPRWTSATPGRR